MKKILLVEDQIELQEIIKRYLEKELYVVTCSNNGKDALSNINANEYDLLILDIMLPEVDGLEVLRNYRSISNKPVIIISAKETEFDKLLGFNLGADDYLTKPFSIRELVVRIKALFRRCENYNITKTNENINFNGIVVNESTRSVFKDDVEIELTYLEFNLLLTLIKNPKRVFARSHLYDIVWGDSYGDLNTVTIHIQKLREKLGDKAAISTVRGVGYRFDGDVK